MPPEAQARGRYRKGAGVMLVNAGGHVFVGQRIDSPGPAWQMPQGGIDKGEAPEEAAFRELCEETGVTRDLVTLVARSADWIHYDLPDDLAGALWKGRYRGQKQLWFLMRFHGRDDQVHIDTDHAEFSRWRWLDPSDLIDVIVPFKRHVYAQVLGEFRPLI